MFFKLAMGGLSLAIMFAAYAVYFWQSHQPDNVQPHPFSWLLWGLVTLVAYFAQVLAGAGPGSWVSGLTAMICFAIGIDSFVRNRWTFSIGDFVSLALGIGVLVFYLCERRPTESAVLATTADVVGYLPTFRKGWRYPHRDSITSFGLNSVKFIPAIAALHTYRVATWLYPATMVVANAGVALMLFGRRQAGDCVASTPPTTP